MRGKSQDVPNPLVTNAILSRYFECTPAYVTSLTAQGVLEKDKKSGYYYLLDNVRAMLKYAKRKNHGQIRGDDDASPLSLTAAKTRISTIKADLEELQYEKAAGNILDTAIVTDVLAELVIQERQHLQAMPAKLAGRVASISDPLMIHRIIQKEVDDVLADFKLESIVEEIRSKSERNSSLGTVEFAETADQGGDLDDL